MQQICTSGSMSGERKRKRWCGLRHRRLAKAAGHKTAPDLMPPRRSSTLPRQPRAGMTKVERTVAMARQPTNTVPVSGHGTYG